MGSPFAAIGKAAAGIFSSSAGELIDKAAAAADRFITTDEDKRIFEVEMKKLALEAQVKELDQQKAYLDDIQSARDMFAKDSSLQKIFAMTFLIGFILLTGVIAYFLLVWAGVKETKVPEWGQSLITFVYGVFSSKIQTIVDFLFGSSQGSQEKNKMIESIKDSAKGI